MNLDIRQQLMALTGVTDEKEFKGTVANLALAGQVAPGTKEQERHSGESTACCHVSLVFVLFLCTFEWCAHQNVVATCCMHCTMAVLVRTFSIRTIQPLI